MKRSLAALLSIHLLVSCSLKDNDSEKFMGEWQSVKYPDNPTWIVQKNGGNITVISGEKRTELLTTFNDENQKLMVNSMMGSVEIAYIKDKDRLLIAGFGEYSRVK